LVEISLSALCALVISLLKSVAEAISSSVIVTCAGLAPEAAVTFT